MWEIHIWSYEARGSCSHTWTVCRIEADIYIMMDAEITSTSLKWWKFIIIFMDSYQQCRIRIWVWAQKHTISPSQLSNKLIYVIRVMFISHISLSTSLVTTNLPCHFHTTLCVHSFTIGLGEKMSHEILAKSQGSTNDNNKVHIKTYNKLQD